MMSKDPIQEIKDLANIVELISEIIPVKRSGSSYLAVCPFHNDTHPSMHISPSKGIFKCFSCGAGGDVFKFWSEFYQKDFTETLKDLANKYGVQLENSNYSKEDTERYNKKIKMHELAAKFYNEQLLASQQAAFARKYLDERAISTTTINAFTFGYSPDDSDRLIKLLKESLKVSDEDIVSAGLALKSENSNGYFDRFRGRLMIPILDERSRVIGFGARTLDPNSKLAKYINSPETEIYNKGSHLFGMNLAKEEIRKKNFVILVEGYFDLISLYQAGFKNVVANQGTALTPRQVKMLVKFSASKKIFLCLDSDRAGQEASDRAAELINSILKDLDYELRIIKIPNGKDPDDFIRSNSAEAFQQLIDLAPNYIDHKISSIISNTDLSSLSAKAKAIQELSKYLGMVNNKVIFVEYRKLISERLSIDENALAEELKRTSTNTDNPYQEENQKKITPNPMKSKFINGHFIETENYIESTEQELILLFIKDKIFIEKFLANNTGLISSKNQIIFEKLIDISFENPDLTNTEEKYNLLQESLVNIRELNDTLSTLGLKIERIKLPKDLDEYFYSLTKRLKEAKLKQKITEVKVEIAKLAESDTAKLEKIIEKSKLEKELHSL